MVTLGRGWSTSTGMLFPASWLGDEAPHGEDPDEDAREDEGIEDPTRGGLTYSAPDSSSPWGS